MNTPEKIDNDEVLSASAEVIMEVANAIIKAVQDEEAVRIFWHKEDELFIIPIAGALTRGQAMLVEAMLQRDHGGIVALERREDNTWVALVPHLNQEI